MKDVIIVWDKKIFNNVDRTLPSSLILYSYIDLDDKLGSWSLVFYFEESPRIQGYISVAKVDFLMDDAPKFILKNGFKFKFLDGKYIVGDCEIIE